jgi:hypothetical protein
MHFPFFCRGPNVPQNTLSRKRLEIKRIFKGFHDVLSWRVECLVLENEGRPFEGLYVPSCNENPCPMNYTSMTAKLFNS